MSDEIDFMSAVESYDPAAWFWLVGENPGFAWSSAATAYVLEGEANPNRTTRINLETELSDVLRRYGIQGPYVSADDVRAEAQRRIIALTGARDLAGCLTKQLNALMRATELTNKHAGGAELTEAEAAEAALLQALADKVKAIRAASNVLETKPPADYTDGKHWPA